MMMLIYAIFRAFASQTSAHWGALSRERTREERNRNISRLVAKEAHGREREKIVIYVNATKGYRNDPLLPRGDLIGRRRKLQPHGDLSIQLEVNDPALTLNITSIDPPLYYYQSHHNLIVFITFIFYKILFFIH